MRNTTKLKHILQLYSVTVDMDEDERIRLSLFHKSRDENHTIIEKSWSAVLAKAYSYFLRNLKD